MTTPRTPTSPRAAARIGAAALLLGLALALSGCALPAILTGGGDRPGETGEPAPPPPPGTTSPLYDDGVIPPPGVAPVLEADPRLVTMTEDLFQRVNTVQGLTFARSEPAGTWQVGKGLPPEFPVGLPLFPDRWVKNGVMEHDNGGRLAISYEFWGGYAEVEAIVAELDRLGFEVDSQIAEDRRAYIAENDLYRVSITVAEGVVDSVNDGVYDPAYSYLVVFRDVKWPGP